MSIFIIIAIIAILAIFFWRGVFRAPSGFNTNAGTTQMLKNLSPQEAYDLIQDQQENADFVILDVRTPAEFKQASIEKAVNVDFYSRSFQSELQSLAPQKTYLVYCRSGNRSASALQIMQKLGFNDAYNMSGGISEWSQRKLPLVS